MPLTNSFVKICCPSKLEPTIFKSFFAIVGSLISSVYYANKINIKK